MKKYILIMLAFVLPFQAFAWDLRSDEIYKAIVKMHDDTIEPRVGGGYNLYTYDKTQFQKLKNEFYYRNQDFAMPATPDSQEEWTNFLIRFEAYKKVNAPVVITKNKTPLQKKIDKWSYNDKKAAYEYLKSLNLK